jgi:hypothetical protein
VRPNWKNQEHSAKDSDDGPIHLSGIHDPIHFLGIHQELRAFC